MRSVTVTRRLPKLSSKPAKTTTPTAIYPLLPKNTRNQRGERERMYGFLGVSTKGNEEVDLESGETLYPGLSFGENQLRWGFIRKVYGILAAQLVLTTIVSSVTVLSPFVNDLLRGNSGLLLFLMFLPLVCT